MRRSALSIFACEACPALCPSPSALFCRLCTGPFGFSPSGRPAALTATCGMPRHLNICRASEMPASRQLRASPSFVTFVRHLRESPEHGVPLACLSDMSLSCCYVGLVSCHQLFPCRYAGAAGSPRYGCAAVILIVGQRQSR